MVKKVGFHLLFACLFILHLWSIHAHIDVLRTISKPLICSSLLAYFIFETRLASGFQKRIALGLFFGLAGDIFLMFSDLFVFGLAAFLIGHLFYVSAFLQQNSAIYLAKNKSYLFIAGLLVTYSYYLFTVLKPSLGTLEIPVILYILTIASMALLAYTRKGQTNLRSFLMIFFGAICFMVSDSILALNKFVAYIPNSGILVMSTYMLAQYLITIGSIKNTESRV